MKRPRTNGYRVRRGDTLWSIAQHQYGDPTLWPEIAKANRLPGGNRILVGMTLTIPTVHRAGGHLPVTAPPPLHEISNPKIYPSQLPTAQPVALSTPVAVPVLFPAVKYELEDLPAIEESTPVADFKLQLTGEITVQKEGVLSELAFSSEPTLTATQKIEYDSEVAKAGGEVKVRWNPLKPEEAEMSCGFTLTTKINGEEFVTHEYHVIPYPPPLMPKFVYTLKPKPIEGKFEDLHFEGTMGYELEITPKDQKRKLESAQAPVMSPETTWIVIGGLALLGTAIIVGDIVKDVGTAGLGTAESPLSWSAAMAMFARAAAMAQ
jgi:hypothetical protein